MPLIRSVFIVEPENQGWIIERLMRDVAAELGVRGITTRFGKGREYDGEEVVFNSRYLTALSDGRARVNSLFITHVDDRAKELELRSSVARFNSFVCMSPHDAEFVAAVKGDETGVVGIELPAREIAVRPVKIAFFSARYPDGRKNEQWIIDTFRKFTPTERAAIVFSFLGWGWESFCEELSKLDMNYEIHRYSRFTPGEYQLYKDALKSADYLIYPGFDGGAMSVYDAINAGIDILASDISYHRDLGENVKLFANQAEFAALIGRIVSDHGARATTLRKRSIQSYVDRLVAHWEKVGSGAGRDSGPPTTPLFVAPSSAERRETLYEFRSHYKSMLSPTRVRSFLIRWVQTRFIRH